MWNWGTIGVLEDGCANCRILMQSLYKSQGVVQVNIPAESGEMGVLANHVPSIEQLKPGLVEVVEEGGSTKQFFRTSPIRSDLPTTSSSHRATSFRSIEGRKDNGLTYEMAI